MLENDEDLLVEFISEANDHIAKMEAGLLRMEETQDDESINEVFRAAHSIKGTAGFFGLSAIVELAHAMETLCGEVRERRLSTTSDIIDVLLAAVDLLKKLVQYPLDSGRFDIRQHVANIEQFLGGIQKQSETCSGLSAWDLWNQLTSSEETEKPDVVKVQSQSPAAKEVARALPEVAPAASYEGKSIEAGKEENVRVGVGLLDDLLNLAGEMVLRRNQLLRITQDVSKQSPQLELVAKGIDQLTTNLQKTIMKARLQPIANVFNKFPRIVRDLSRRVGKEVDLDIRGMDVELDRSLVEALVDPMTHLVRNAIDHGIESASVRQLANKPVTGTLILRAYHENGRVIVEICDDGAGIDLAKVTNKAMERGLVSKESIAVMSDAEITHLIMLPGFSTAERITDISGRGVGMDVVKTNIEKIGGKIEIYSELGRGSTFRLVLPLTLEIIPSFIVLAEGQSFAIPQANVKELLLIQPGDANGKHVEKVHNQSVLRLRERLLPLVCLGTMLAQETSIASAVENEGLYKADQAIRILVIKTGKFLYGLVVDSVYDTEEILVKPLSPILKNCGLYSGATVLGDGNIAMILDTERIAQLAGFSPDGDSLLAVAQSSISVDTEKQYILLFRCSGSEILGLDLAMVSRVEKVDVSQLIKVGSKYYFSFQGNTIRVIRPEHYLPISRKRNSSSLVYIILPKMVKHPVGIIAEEIYDSVYAKVSLDRNGVCGKGILGSAHIHGMVVTLVNLHELFIEAVPEYYNQSDVGKRLKDTSFNRSIAKTKKSILLVEDTLFFLKLVKNYLESEGFEVITAENGLEALERLQEHTIDVVVSDIEMPGMNGIELVRAIRASETLCHLPVIALTSLTGEKNIEKGLRAGFDLYEYKLNRARLLDKVYEVLHNRGS